MKDRNFYFNIIKYSKVKDLSSLLNHFHEIYQIVSFNYNNLKIKLTSS